VGQNEISGIQIMIDYSYRVIYDVYRGVYCIE